MNNSKLKLIAETATPGVIAAAVILLSFSLPFAPDRLVGFGAVAFLAGVAALEYRVTWKRFFSR